MLYFHTQNSGQTHVLVCVLSSATVNLTPGENGQGQTDCKSQLLYSAGFSYLETAVEPPSRHTELTAAHSHGDAFILQKHLAEPAKLPVSLKVILFALVISAERLGCRFCEERADNEWRRDPGGAQEERG